MSFLRVATVFVACFGFTSEALAQEPETRAATWRTRREEKALELSAPTRTGLESLLLRLNPEQYMREVNTGFYGLAPVFGGMETGSGFTVGALYQKNELAKGRFDLEATARVSSKRYQQYAKGGPTSASKREPPRRP